MTFRTLFLGYSFVQFTVDESRLNSKISLGIVFVIRGEMYVLQSVPPTPFENVSNSIGKTSSDA